MPAVFRAFSWVPAGSQKIKPMEPTDTPYITWFISVSIVLGLNTFQNLFSKLLVVPDRRIA